MLDQLAGSIAGIKSAHDETLNGLLSSAVSKPVDALTVKRFESAALSATQTFTQVVDNQLDCFVDDGALLTKQLIYEQMLSDVAQAKLKLFRFVITPRTADLPSLKASELSDAKVVRALLGKTLPISIR